MQEAAAILAHVVRAVAVDVVRDAVLPELLEPQLHALLALQGGDGRHVRRGGRCEPRLEVEVCGLALAQRLALHALHEGVALALAWRHARPTCTRTRTRTRTRTTRTRTTRTRTTRTRTHTRTRTRTRTRRCGHVCGHSRSGRYRCRSGRAGGGRGGGRGGGYGGVRILAGCCWHGGAGVRELTALGEGAGDGVERMAGEQRLEELVARERLLEDAAQVEGDARERRGVGLGEREVLLR